MWKRAATVTAIAVLAIGLLAGSLYYVLRPNLAHAEGGRGARGNRGTEVIAEANGNAFGLRGCGQVRAGISGGERTCDETCEGPDQERDRLGQGDTSARSGRGNGRLGHVLCRAGR